MRLMVYDLHPIALEQTGLVDALRHRLETVEKRSGLQINFQVVGDVDSIPKQMSQELYRIAIEALNNATKHSRANRIGVDLIVDQHIIELGVRDNGCGFDPVTAKEQGGMGLLSLQERTKMLNGKLSIETGPGQGAYVKLQVPIP
jgi:signal transduction histidine kinase